MKTKIASCFFLVLLIFLRPSAASAASASAEHPAVTVFTHGGKDPLEGFNSSMESTNAFFSKYFLHPVSLFYCNMIPDGVTERIGNFKDNILFPVRALNNCLQGKFENAWNETKRFGINTTIGVLGFGDPATDMDIPCHDEDFGQTLAAWGVGDGCYVNLPLLGPSTLRDAPSLIVDSLLNPVNYASPYIMPALNSNGQLRSAAFINNYFRTHYVTYPLTRTMYLASRDVQLRDGTFPPVTSSPDEALGVLRLTPRKRLFYSKSGNRTVTLPGARRKLDYTYFPQKDKTPRIMFILPGLTTTRLDNGMTALAEMFYKKGWSVAIVSSTFTADFFMGTPSQLPGIIRKDAENLDAALALIRDDLAKNVLKSDDAPQVAVFGVSLGAINALLLAERDARGTGCLFPNRIIAVNPPRNPLMALKKLDELFDIPLSWPENERLERTRTAIERLAYALLSPKAAELQLNNDESMFLIGMGMRLGMVDLLAELKDNPDGRNLVSHDVSLDDDGQFMRDALNFSYETYAETMLLPYAKQQKLLPEDETMDSFAEKCTVDTIAENLDNYPKLRLVHARNDFLLAKGDPEWFQNTFGDRCTLLPNGSHLGFLASPEAQKLLTTLAN